MRDNRESAAKLKRTFGRLFVEVEAALFRADPMGLNFEDNTDEYEFEARGIVPRLGKCGSEDDVCRVVASEFDAQLSDPSRLNAAAAEIWHTLHRRKHKCG